MHLPYRGARYPAHRNTKFKKKVTIMDQIAYNNDSQFNALLSDEVVMQWLMDLEESDRAEEALNEETGLHA